MAAKRTYEYNLPALTAQALGAEYVLAKKVVKGSNKDDKDLIEIDKGLETAKALRGLGDIDDLFLVQVKKRHIGLYSDYANDDRLEKESAALSDNGPTGVQNADMMDNDRSGSATGDDDAGKGKDLMKSDCEQAVDQAPQWFKRAFESAMASFKEEIQNEITDFKNSVKEQLRSIEMKVEARALQMKAAESRSIARLHNSRCSKDTDLLAPLCDQTDKYPQNFPKDTDALKKMDDTCANELMAQFDLATETTLPAKQKKLGEFFGVGQLFNESS